MKRVLIQSRTFFLIALSSITLTACAPTAWQDYSGYNRSAAQLQMDGANCQLAAQYQLQNSDPNCAKSGCVVAVAIVNVINQANTFNLCMQARGWQKVQVAAVTWQPLPPVQPAMQQQAAPSEQEQADTSADTQTDAQNTQTQNDESADQQSNEQSDNTANDNSSQSNSNSSPKHQPMYRRPMYQHYPMHYARRYSQARPRRQVREAYKKG